MIAQFEKLGGFVHATWPPEEHDRESCRKEVVERLKFHCAAHTFSDLIIEQLIDLIGKSYVEICDQRLPYNVTEVFWCMELISTNQCQDKVFNKKGSLLRGRNIYHAHHAQTHYTHFNLIRYFKEKYPDDESILKAVHQLQAKHPGRNDHWRIFASKVFQGSLHWNKKTGEWIVYEKDGGKINFLCLYIHDHDDKNDSRLNSLIAGHTKFT